jgi:hypothetical protein
MTEMKIYRTVELALEEAPRDQWTTSAKVSRALLGCIRTKGIVRQHLLKRGVSLSVYDDVISEIAVVVQMKMLQRLESISDVYFVIFRVSQLVVANWGKRAAHSISFEEISLSSFRGDHGDDGSLMDRLTSESMEENQGEQNERRIDLENAKRRFTEKVGLVGWPDDIKKVRIRLGRPPKAGQPKNSEQS